MKINVEYIQEQANYRIEEILDALSINYIKSNKYYHACCPIHNGDNPRGWYWMSDVGSWRCHTRKCELEKIVFYSNITINSLWDEFDILLTANPNLLLNHPDNKKVIKFNTEYNKDINKYDSIQSLKELETLLKRIIKC